MSWLTTDYPFNGNSGGGGVPGTIANVPADGSSTITVTIPIKFANAISSVVLTPQGTGAAVLDPQVVPGSMTANQFTVVCVGGAVGSFVTLNYVAYGS